MIIQEYKRKDFSPSAYQHVNKPFQLGVHEKRVTRRPLLAHDFSMDLYL